MGFGWMARVHPDDLDEMTAAWAAAAGAGRDFEHEYRLLVPAGTPERWVRVRIAPLRDASGAPDGAVGAVEDVTARRAADAALRASEERLRIALGVVEMTAWERDLHTDDIGTGGVIEASGRDGARAEGSADAPGWFDAYAEFLAAVHPDDRPRVAGENARAVAERGTLDVEFRVRAPDGALRWWQTSARVIAGGRGAPDRMVGVTIDVTARKALEAELTQRAFHDPLTRLANRARFRERIERALARPHRERVAVLFLDLDDFKTVNDSLGHAAGDLLLVEVAARLLNATRGCDTVARLGGDEFAILIENAHAEADVVVVAERVVAAMRAPVTLEGREVRIGTSVGIARGGRDATADELLRNADVALYRAKELGKSRHATFSPEMHQAVLDRLDMQTELRHALERREFAVVYQPIVDLGSGQVTGAEALVRWHHPRRGLVAPDAFIGLAEETGAIVGMGRWVLGEACRQAARWTALAAGASPDEAAELARFEVAVNVSGRQLQRPEFAGEVAEALAEAGLAPRRLVLEITESVLMADTEATLERLHALKALGVQLAIDDFGTGYSSLAYLHRFPIDVLKLDKAFVGGVAGGGKDAALARAILALGDALGLRTVAEGVETAEQRGYLQGLGCQSGQGYLFSRPVGPERLDEAVAGGAARGRPRAA